MLKKDHPQGQKTTVQLRKHQKKGSGGFGHCLRGSNKENYSLAANRTIQLPTMNFDMKSQHSSKKSSLNKSKSSSKTLTQTLKRIKNQPYMQKSYKAINDSLEKKAKKADLTTEKNRQDISKYHDVDSNEVSFLEAVIIHLGAFKKRVERGIVVQMAEHKFQNYLIQCLPVAHNADLDSKRKILLTQVTDIFQLLLKQKENHHLPKESKSIELMDFPYTMQNIPVHDLYTNKPSSCKSHQKSTSRSNIKQRESRNQKRSSKSKDNPPKHVPYSITLKEDNPFEKIKVGKEPERPNLNQRAQVNPASCTNKTSSIKEDSSHLESIFSESSVYLIDPETKVAKQSLPEELKRQLQLDLGKVTAYRNVK